MLDPHLLSLSSDILKMKKIRYLVRISDERVEMRREKVKSMKELKEPMEIENEINFPSTFICLKLSYQSLPNS